MAARKPFLSKSRLIAAWQCPKKLYLEKHRRDLAVITPQMESMFAGGHQVGDIAKALYGTPASVEIPFQRKMSLMVQETRQLIEQGTTDPVFEATFQTEGVLVRVDVLIPQGDNWRVIEVKASTSVKDYHVLDCAIQDWVLRNSGIAVDSISLAHINNRFLYPGGGDYAGLLIENDLTEEVRSLEPRVVELIAKAREAVTGPMPVVNVGGQCNKPYDCQFQSYCWPTETRYPITGLGGSKAKLGEYVALGARDILDVDEHSITAATQQRIYRVTCKGEAEILEDARHVLEALPYPRYYLDFETIAPGVPFWAGTRPYSPVPVQWSCHIEDAYGELRHEEFLDLSGEPPMRALAERLIACLGGTGPVLMYTNYEAQVIDKIIEILPDLAEPLQDIKDRLFDLHPVVKANYYHPKMLGSWSIKAVLPTINPDMDYAKLEGIVEGTGASDGFIEAINPDTDMVRKLELEEQLLRYCRFDTEAMVEIVRFFTTRGD
jgi:CRISPR/Cas system-associated exonuclease Cas4 (RecB family)